MSDRQSCNFCTGHHDGQSVASCKCYCSSRCNPVCAGTTVNFTATPTNGGAAPVYQWKVNGVNAGVNAATYSYIPLTGDIVTVDLTSNAVCPTGNPATSAPVTMTVNPLLPVSVTVAADVNTVCAGP